MKSHKNINETLDDMAILCSAYSDKLDKLSDDIICVSERFIELRKGYNELLSCIVKIIKQEEGVLFK